MRPARRPHIPHASAITLVAVLMLVWTATAQARIADGGWAETNTNLAIRPDADPLEMNLGNGPAMFVKMPVTKEIANVTMGNFRSASTCPVPAYVELRIEEHTGGDPYSAPTSTVVSTAAPALTTTPDTVTWAIPTTKLQEGHDYAFKVVARGDLGCVSVKKTTWAHDDPVVWGGTTPCAQSSADLGWWRSWHTTSISTDNGCGAANFSDDMPSGWLAVMPSVGTSRRVVTYSGVNPPPPGSCAKTGDDMDFGGGWKYWRVNPSESWKKDYV